MPGREAIRSSTGPTTPSRPRTTVRTLTPDGHQRLATITAELTHRIHDRETTLRRFDVEPGDAHRYRQAIERRVERDAHTLTARPPHWLTHLLGHRPADVAGAHTYDDALRDVAHWRAHHQLPDDVAGLGGRPTEPGSAEVWDRLQLQLGHTRTWLAATDRIHPTDTITASHDELLDRRAHLDEHFAAAPVDWRDTITALQAGQLTLDDTDDLLHATLQGQAERRQWIIANWPHIVEYQEINRTLTTGTWGPDPLLLTDLLTQPITQALTHAIERDEPWLRGALNQVADGHTTHLDDDAISHLAAIANGGMPTPLDRAPNSQSRDAASTNVDVHADVGSIELDVDI